MSGMDLVEFLNARLDEDERAARDAHYEGQHWLSEEEDVWRWPDDEPVYTADRKRDAAHIVRWQPARVLADVAAKRQLVVALAGYVPVDMHFLDDVTASRAHVALLGLTHLALPYADHPDYREEWKP